MSTKCRRQSGFVFTAIATTLLLSDCTANQTRDPLPEADLVLAKAVATPDQEIRIWGDQRPETIDAFLNASTATIRSEFSGIYQKPHTYLALSGGGQNGAFGAGLLSGWTASGTRPEFTMVTGISTGSLIAPFAFLGPAHDQQLTEVYTQYGTKDLITQKPVLVALFSSALADTKKLRNLIAEYMDEDFIALIAAEHRRGRRLYIGTTNLDARRPVLWKPKRSMPATARIISRRQPNPWSSDPFLVRSHQSEQRFQVNALG